MSKHTTIPPEKRFWKYVDTGPFTDCWEWTGATRNGYGVIRIKRKTIYAHRFCYELHYGPLPEGIEVCHSCDRPTCCNPYHLFAGTHQDNIRDMYTKKRGKGGAKKGQSPTLTEDNVIEIRKLAAQGMRYPALAEQFNVSIPAICLIVNRKRWRRVP